MELSCLIDALSQPDAYPFAVRQVEVRQTHISVVFLAGEYAFKIKKPVTLGFLDYSTLAKRRQFCELETHLNRRLAPSVYLGVVPVTRTGDGMAVEGTGEPVEWAVKMMRLPAEGALLERLQGGEVDSSIVESLAHRIASFHASAQAGDHISAYGRFDAVARNVRENLDQSVHDLDVTVSRAVFHRLKARTEELLRDLQPLIDERAQRGSPREGHGDLRLEHVYLFPDQKPPQDVVVIDCIEFNERFRYLDPVADMAFLAMDLVYQGRRDLARSFADAYFRALGNDEGRGLLTFYTAYRAAVRGKVEGLKRLEAEVPERERADALERAKGYWLLALAEIEETCRKPCLVLVGGLPGAGKSTLARLLAEQAGFDLVSSDVTRKRLAALSAGAAGDGPRRQQLYMPAWNDRTYAACLQRARELLFEGRRVVVDATFREEDRRRTFLAAAMHYRVPAVFLLCRVEPSVAQERLKNRPLGPSDADWLVYQQLAASWEVASTSTQAASREILTGGTHEQTLSRALEALSQFGLSNQPQNSNAAGSVA